MEKRDVDGGVWYCAVAAIITIGAAVVTVANYINENSDSLTEAYNAGYNTTAP